MLPELGHFALILALGINILLILSPFVGHLQNTDDQKERFLKITRPLALAQCFCIVLSYLVLTYAFINNDFSVEYAARHSNSSLPFMYKLSAVWSGHEGSLLLWVLFLAGWTAAVVLSSRALALNFLSKVLVVLSIVSAGFLVFLLLTSNPFIRLLPDYPLDGKDLNPLLQDIGLIIHPPLLYLGYVGFTVPFAFAITTLWIGEMKEAWVHWVRPFLLTAWSFLTLGIALGSWWAYYELGWGGWWFWDPVENASFIPWLSATALVHSLIITSKRKQFLGWTTLLAIITFAFCLLGTFLVRSGILMSVHTFANDPKRGIFILQLIALFIGTALILYSIRVRKLSLYTPIHLYSRESLIVVNTLLFLVTALSILIGTVFPMVYEMFTQQKISVGFPYFNSIFVPLMIPILCSVPLGPFTRWGENYPFFVVNQLKWTLFLSIVIASLIPWLIMKNTSLSVIAGIFLGAWVGLGTLQRMVRKMAEGGLNRISLGGWGMILGHVGVAVVVIGVVIVSNYSVEKEVQLATGMPLQIADYQVTLHDIQSIEGSNYIGHQARFTLEKNGKYVSELIPEKRLFVIPGLMMTETAIDPGVFRDIYISLGDKLPKGGYTARVYYKPFVRWIWGGAVMIAAGALLAAFHRKRAKT